MLTCNYFVLICLTFKAKTLKFKIENNAIFIHICPCVGKVVDQLWISCLM